ncbi:MAG: PAS domain S-box protein [Promethearchaeia archaeon]
MVPEDVGEQSNETREPKQISKRDMLRLRDMMENQPVPTAEIDTNHTVLWANASGRRLLGVSKNTIKDGINLDEFVPDEYKKLVSRVLDRIGQNNTDSSLSLRIVRPDGMNIPVEASAQRIIHQHSLVGFLLHAVDVSQRRNKNFHTAENSNLHEFVVEYSPSGILVVGDDFTFKYVNACLCNILGRTRSEIIGHDFRDFLHPDSMDFVSDRYLRKQKREKVPNTYEFKILRHDGTPRDVRITCTTMKGQDGLVKSVAQMLDITEKKRSQRALHESERKSRTLVETMNDGLGMDNTDGEIVYVNQALVSMLGYSRDEILGMNGADILHGHSRKEENERKRRRREGEIEHYECNLLQSNGELLPVLISASPLHSPDGEYLGSVAIFTDVSEIKDTEAEVRFLLDLLLHDIGNQLQLIIAGTDLCNMDVNSSMVDTGREYILDGAQRCLELISKIRQSETENDRPPHSIDITSIVEAEINLLSKRYPVEVMLSGFERDTLIMADKAISSLVWNLLENAVKHNPRKKKKVWVEGHREGREFVLKVADNGIGLRDEGKKGVFESRRSFGGVGLHLVRRLATKYSAPISVDDRVSGKTSQGLEVTVRFQSAE